MTLLRRIVGMVSAVAALAACDEGPSSNLSFTTTPDVWSFVTAAAASAPLPVEVYGNPFRQPAGLVVREVTEAAAAAFTEPWLRFEAVEKADPARLRLVWLLDPAEGFNADQVCAGNLPGFTDRRITELRAVMCHRDRPLSAAHGWVRKPDMPADPRWRQLIGQMARQVLTGRG